VLSLNTLWYQQDQDATESRYGQRPLSNALTFPEVTLGLTVYAGHECVQFQVLEAGLHFCCGGPLLAVRWPTHCVPFLPTSSEVDMVDTRREPGIDKSPRKLLD